MTNYKFIFVISSSSDLTPDNPYYDNANNYLERYNNFKILNKMYYDKFKNDIKFFYVEYKENIEHDVIEIDDYIYVKGSDLPFNPNSVIKIIKSIGYINDKYSYDYIIHTNLSSVWNIPLLLSLHNEIPRTNFFGGYYIFNSFITGTGIFFSHDIIPVLMQLNAYIYFENNDVTISEYMKWSGIPIFDLSNMLNYKWEIISDNYSNENYDNILYFRIKTASSSLDINIFKFVINKLYNITV